MNSLVPSLGLSLALTSELRGCTIAIPLIHHSCNRYKSLMESLPYEGSKLFNTMPKYIRNLNPKIIG